jgi:hypothetical protein
VQYSPHICFEQQWTLSELKLLHDDVELSSFSLHLSQKQQQPPLPLPFSAGSLYK